MAPRLPETVAPVVVEPASPQAEPVPSPATRVPELAPYARTMRLLALLLGVAGLGSGILSYQAGESVQGLWTFGTSIVGAFALYVLGEALKVIAATYRLVASREET